MVTIQNIKSIPWYIKFSYGEFVVFSYDGLHCVVFHCVALYYFVWRCTTLRYIALYWAVFYVRSSCVCCFSSYIALLHYIALYCVLCSCVAFRCVIITFRCVVLRCFTLHYIALYCVLCSCVAFRCVIITFRCVVLRCFTSNCNAVTLCCVAFCCVGLALHFIELYRVALECLEPFLYSRERIGKLIVTSKREKNYFLLFLSTITNQMVYFLSKSYENRTAVQLYRQYTSTPQPSILPGTIPST